MLTYNDVIIYWKFIASSQSISEHLCLSIRIRSTNLSQVFFIIISQKKVPIIEFFLIFKQPGKTQAILIDSQNVDTQEETKKNRQKNSAVEVQVKFSNASYNKYLKRLFNFPMERVQTSCFICGNYSCQEQADHQKMTYNQFNNFLKAKAGYQSKIAKLKYKIRKCYKKLEKITNQNLEQYTKDLLLIVDKLHFWHLLRFSNSLKDIQAVIFGFMLPRTQMTRLLHFLNKQADSSIVFPKFDRLLYEVHRFKKECKKVIQKNKYAQLFEIFVNIIHGCEKQFNRDCFAKRNQNFTQIDAGVPNLKLEQSNSQLVLIEGIPFSTMRKNIDLSVLQITDSLLLNYLPSLQKMKDLVEFQIRNNRLSQKGYKMLFNALPQLQSLDVSSSNSDNFFKVLGDKLPKLKTLYVNQTSLNDQKLLTIAQKLQNIRVIFADLNRISCEGATELFKNKKQVMFVSMKGNLITEQLGRKIQTNLAIKGGYLQY